jgi:hypothetical protein
MQEQMKKLIVLNFILLILLAFVACKKDKGNYAYTDPNFITITTDTTNADRNVVINNDSVVVKQDDTLKLDIVLTQTKLSDDLSYQWMITQTAAANSNPPQYVVGTQKQLRAKITLSPNLYRLVVKVTDNKTGISYYKFYNLNVNTAPWGGEGWLVLQDQPTEGGSDISIITDVDGSGSAAKPVYSNLYFQANGSKLPTGTYKTAVLNYNNTLRIQKVSFFYPNGGTQVRSIDYLDSSHYDGWFLVPPSVINIQSNDIMQAAGQYEYMMNNGQIFFQQVNTVTLKAPPIRFSVPFLGSWSDLNPNVILGNSDGVFTIFDKTNHSFLSIWNNGGTPTLIPTSLADVPNAHYKPYSGAGGATNFGPTAKGFDMNSIKYDLMYAENATQMRSGNTIYYDCIFRTTAGDSTFLFQFPGSATGASGGYTNNFTTGRFLLREDKVPGINTASIFAMPTFLPVSATTYGVFYYVHGTNKNSIYVCNPSYTGTMPATTTSTLGYNFPNGTIIKSMKILKSGYTTTTSLATEGKMLVVATDETANGKGNNVYFFNLAADGSIVNTPARVYTGFDKIVDITFKKALGQ